MKNVIPFQSEGSTIYFESFVPSDEELEYNHTLILTDDETEWDPTSIVLGQHPLSANEVFVKQVERRGKRNLKFLHETDMILGSISDALVESTMTEQMVKLIQIEDNLTNRMAEEVM